MAYALQFSGDGYLTAGSPHNALATTSYRLLIVGAFPGTPAVAYIIQGNNGNDRVRIRIDNFNFFEIRYTTSSSRVRWSVDPLLWFDGLPHTFKVVRSGNTHELFIDDISQGQSSSSTTASDTANFIGRANTSTTDPYNLYSYTAYDSDVDGSLIFDYAGKDGTGTELVNSAGTNAVQQDTWPVDDSEWLYYDDGSGGGGEEQVVVPITATESESASVITLNGQQNITTPTATEAEQAQVLDIISTQQLTPIIATESECAQLLSAEQFASLKVSIATELEQASAISLSNMQAVSYAIATESECASTINVEVISDQIVTVITATESEQASFVAISHTQQLTPIIATESEQAQLLDVISTLQLSPITATESEQASWITIIQSAGDVDISKLRLVPITTTYKLEPINQVHYSLEIL